MAKDYRDEPQARVFISCGQSKQSDEVTTAGNVAERLRKLGFEPYIATQYQTLRGLKENIFERLADSEYFIFVDFKREVLEPGDKAVHRGSLFSHQELAIASYLDIPVLAFQESGVKWNDGILQFVQANPISFTDRNLLPAVIADMVHARGWDPHWRNELALERGDPRQRGDSPKGMTTAGYYHIAVRNRHRSKTARECYVYLEKAVKLDPRTEIDLPAAELTWAGYTWPNVRIPPGTARKFDAFFILSDRPAELQFQTFSNSPEFTPRIAGPGRYELTYSVVSNNFPTARETFILTLSPSFDATTLEIKTGDV